MKLLKQLWKRYMQHIDKHFLGNAIDKAAKEHNAPQEYRDLAWGLHKLYDSNYGPEDFTDGEKTAVEKWFTKQMQELDNETVS